MKPLDTYLILWVTVTKVYLAEVRVDATLEKWESLSNREEVCEFIRILQVTDEHGYRTCTVVSPAGFTYSAEEFLTDMCACPVPKQPQPEPRLDAMSMPSYTQSEFSIFIASDGIYF